MGRRGIAPALLAGLCLGCFAFDEIDRGLEDMQKRSTSRTAAEKQAAKGPSKPKGKSAGSPMVNPAEWWRKSRSLGAEDLDENIVRCELRGSTQFMRRSDCVGRGGSAG